MFPKEALHNIDFAPNKSVLSPDEVLNDFAKEASRARHIVAAQTMSLEDDVTGKKLLEIFESVGPGVTKQLFVDHYANLVMGQDMYELNRHVPWLTKEMEAKFKKKQAFIKQFEKAGVEVKFTNTPKNFLERLIPISGRNHLKGIQVDDTVYIGGLNMEDGTAEGVEFMVKFTGDARAAKLASELTKIRNGEITEDSRIPIDEDTTLLFDVGMPGQSIILKNAIRLIKGATDYVYLTSYFTPDGETAVALNEAQRRDVRVKVVSSISLIEEVLRGDMRHLVVVSQKLNKLKAIFFDTDVFRFLNPFRFVHAKLLLLRYEKTHYAQFGTHNLASAGVRVGTQELAIETKDPELVRNLHARFADFRWETDPRLQEVF